MLDILKNIVSETLDIYALATLDGKLFIPFFIGCIYLLLSRDEAHSRARTYLVYPSLIIMFIVFNPVIIHLIYKYIRVEERIVRLYWPLPMDAVIVYCFVHALHSVKGHWRKIILSAAAVFLLLLGTGFEHSGQSYTLALNPQKMPAGTKDVCDAIYEYNLHEPCDVILPDNLFYWVRSYRSAIQIPFMYDMRDWYDENHVLDLDTVGRTGAENNCKYVVLHTGEQFSGELEKYGYSEFLTVPAGDDSYIIYRLAP